MLIAPGYTLLLPTKSKFSFPSTVSNLDIPPGKLFLAVPAFSAELLLPLNHKCWKSEIFPNE